MGHMPIMPMAPHGSGYPLQEQERGTTIAIAIVGRATIHRKGKKLETKKLQQKLSKEDKER